LVSADLEQFDEAFDTEVGEGDDAVIVETVDPDEAVFGLASAWDAPFASRQSLQRKISMTAPRRLGR
jgi:hypothetical protein